MITFDKLSRNSLILFILTMVGNVANYFFQFYMARNLSTGDFGILNTLLSLMMILTVPTGTILMVLAKYSSYYKALNDMAQVRALFLYTLRKVFFYSSLGLAFFLLLKSVKTSEK